MFTHICKALKQLSGLLNVYLNHCLFLHSLGTKPLIVVITVRVHGLIVHVEPQVSSNGLTTMCSSSSSTSCLLCPGLPFLSLLSHNTPARSSWTVCPVRKRNNFLEKKIVVFRRWKQRG